MAPTTTRDHDRDDALPLCADCYGRMEIRASDTYCTYCNRYGRNVGVVRPTDPMHPDFEDLVRSDPELLEGFAVLRYPYTADGSVEEEHLGQIAELLEPEEILEIRTDVDEPFGETIRTISLDRFFDYLWTPGPSDRPIPNELRLGVIR